MTYSTPELLLVGAAQSLVLGGSPLAGKPQYLCELPIEPDDTLEDENAW